MSSGYGDIDVAHAMSTRLEHSLDLECDMSHALPIEQPVGHDELQFIQSRRNTELGQSSWCDEGIHHVFHPPRRQSDVTSDTRHLQLLRRCIAHLHDEWLVNGKFDEVNR